VKSRFPKRPRGYAPRFVAAFSLSLAEIELAFARSRRRALARRKTPPRRGVLAWRSVRAVMLALILLALVAESTRVESPGARPLRPRAAPAPRCPVPVQFRGAFTTAAAKARLSLSLLVAVAYEESRMDPGATSGAGARGLLQLMPATARELRLEGDDPAANVLAGARYLRRMIDHFGTTELALAAYNAGPGAVERAGAAPTLGTLRYVLNVEARATALAACVL
jgi:soluble lytic murein transglycosylase-like protein